MNSVKAQKVLFVHDGPVYKDGAGQYYGLHYNNKLIERYLALGNQICMMTRLAPLPADCGTQFSKIDHPAFSVLEFPNLKNLKNRILQCNSAHQLAKIAVLKADLIIARLPSSSASIAVEYALRYDKPLLVEFVACGWDAYWNYSWKGKLLAPYFFIRQRLRMLRVPYTIYVTNSFLQKRYPSRGRNIGVSDVELPDADLVVLEKRINKINAQPEHHIPVLGTIAALDVPYKGQADVIQAIYLLKKNGIALRYQLVGQGDSSRLEQLIERLDLHNQVTIIGALPHQEIFSFLDRIDVYIQPSKTEGLPRAVVEAMSRGCTVLGSAVGGIPELIAEQNLFIPGKPTAIAAKLEKLTKSVFLKAAHSNFKASSVYSRQLLAEKRNAFYQEFLENYQLTSFEERR